MLTTFQLRIVAAVALMATFSSTAFAQTCATGSGGSRFGGYRRRGNANFPNLPSAACNQSRASMFANYSSSLPDLSNYSHSLADAPNVPSAAERERERRLEMMEGRRAAEKERREAARKTIPVKYYTDDDRADSQFKTAHLLYRVGKPDASKRQLEQLIEKFPATETAGKAQLVLARF